MTSQLHPTIPDDFYTSRPLFKELRDEALRLCAGPDAVLWSYLALTAAHMPWQLSINSGIGKPKKPTLFVVLAGGSGDGKTLAWNVAQGLMQPPLLTPKTPSTGQGLAEAFFEYVPVLVPQPPNRKGEAQADKLEHQKQRVRWNLLLWQDEGEALFKLRKRDDSILLPELRKFFSDEGLGQLNAGREHRREVESGTYVGAFVMGLQNKVAGELLADTMTGTVQRFVFSSVLHPALADAAMPETVRGPQPLSFTPPWVPGTPQMPTGGGLLERFYAQPSPGQAWTPAPTPPPFEMTVEGSIREELWKRQTNLRSGQQARDERDSHRDTQWTKLAGVLAWLDQSLVVRQSDWELAGTLLDTSDAVRAALVDVAASVEYDQNQEVGFRRAEQERAKLRAEGARDKCEKKILQVLKETPDGLLRGELTEQITGGLRAVYPRVLAELVESGTVAEEKVAPKGRRYRLGGSSDRDPGIPDDP